MVVPSRLHYWTIVLTLVSVLSLYLTLVNLTIPQEDRRYGAPVKKIVAYSLLKQIERDSEEVECGFKEGEFQQDNGTELGQSNWTQIDRTNVFVYSVHRDPRLEPFHFVRIIAMVKGFPNASVFCQLINQDGSFFVTKTTSINIWSDDWDQNSKTVYYNPILMSCRIPLGTAPVSVRITTNPCDIDVNSSRYTLDKPNKAKKMFTMCVKPLKFEEDISRKIVQWIEINRILGAERIEIYVGRVKENVKKILQWYSGQKSIEIATRQFTELSDVEPINTPPTYEEITEAYAKHIWQKRRYEVIVYNDCFYRNLQTSQFIIPLDVDEIILPLKVKTWSQLLRLAFETHPGLENGFASLCVSNAYYFRESEQKEPVYFFNDVTRSELSQNGESCKSFVSTRNTLTVFNHYALDVLKPGIGRNYFLPTDIVQMNHYKENCSTVILPECTKYFSSPVKIKDLSIFRYRDQFYKNYDSVVKKLNLKSIFIV